MIPDRQDTPALPGMFPDRGGLLARATRALRHHAVRLRWELAPFYGSATFGAVVELHAATGPGWGTPLAYGVVAAVSAGATLPLVDRQPAVAYGTASLAAATAWASWQTAAGPGVEGGVILALLTTGLSVRYWRYIAERRDHHADNQVAVEVERYRAISRTAAPIPAQRAAPAIEAPHDDTDVADLPTVEWPGARPGLSITDPIPLSDRVSIVLPGGHVLVGGGTDAGKSNIVHIIASTVITRSNAQLLGIDMKPGAVELGVYRKAGARIASSKRDALDMLVWVRDEGERRGERMGATIHDEGTLTRSWTPTEQDPHLVLVIDELAELVDAAPDAAKILKSHTRLLRAMGITVLAATQSPSRHVFGGDSDSRGQYGTRICVATFEPTQTNIILGQGAHGAGWRADLLDGRGSFLIQSRNHRSPAPDRAYYMTDRALAQHVNNWAAVRGAAQPEDEPEAFPTPEPAPRPGRIENATQLITDYLRDHGPATPEEVAEALGYPEKLRSFRTLMRRHAGTGLFKTVGDGTKYAVNDRKRVAGNVVRFPARDNA